MFDLLTMACGLVVAFFALTTYFRYGDAFHPAVFIAPLMFAGYCLWPLVLNREGDLEFLLGRDDSVRIQTYYLAGLTVFFGTLSIGGNQRALRQQKLSPWQDIAATVQGTRARRRLTRLATILAVVASAAYWYSIFNVGGFDQAYSGYKGGGYAESGYIGEAALLAYPAALIYSLARQGKGFGVVDWVLVLAILSPNLFQGTYGVRRGPLFISLAILFVSWVVARGRVPGLFRTVIVVSSILLAVGFMWTQRQIWFADDPASNGRTGLESTFLPSTDDLWQNDYVSGMGSALITEYYDAHFWGKRWFVDLIIRPIPKQIWPTKYADVGAYWKEGGNPTGFEESEQIRVLGFPLPAGHSIGVLSDLYSEWWWGALFFLSVLGYFLRWLWFKHRTIGQVWTVVFLVAIGLCVYLPTQSFSAWYQRFLIMAVGSYFSWRWVVGMDVRENAKRVSEAGDWKIRIPQGRR